MSIFGQNPADITGAVFKSKNLSDLPDKAAARTNLNVPSKDDVLYNSIPVGMILPYWGSVAPSGYLPCSGQTVTSASFPDLVTFLGGGSTAVLPDLRGEFLRGWDNGRGVDPGRAIGTFQFDIIKQTALNAGSLMVTGGTGTSALISVGGTNYISRNSSEYTVGTGTETRPRNIAVLYCIKAYSSISNYTSSINVAGLASDYSTLNSSAAKYADFQGANQLFSGQGYQKLPGGLIIQWGSGAASPTVGTAVTITYPTAFPVRTAGVYVTRTATGVISDINSFAVDVTTNINFPIRCQLANASFYWFAVGY